MMPNPLLPTLDFSWPRASRLAPWWPADSLDARQQSLAHVLRGAIHGQVAAAPLVAGLAEEHRWRARWRLNRLAERLDLGMPLADALEQTPGALADDGVLAIRFGSQLGILPAALDGLVRDGDVTGPRIRARIRGTTWYLGSVLLIGTMIASFILIKIVPMFHEILQDYSMTAPWALRTLIGVGNFATSFWFVPLLIVLAVAWIASMGPPRWLVRRLLSARILLPMVQLRSADLLELLALASRAGRPLAGAISTLARYHFDGPIRRKLLFVRNEIEQGAGLWESLEAVRLITPAEARVLKLDSPVASQAWTMAQLARARRARVAGQIETLLDWLEPACLVPVAGGVLLVALAVMIPLTQMIHNLP
jgi:type II secretory pathway component PulF